MKNNTKTLTYSGLMAALTFISTSILSFPSPFTAGYIHIGDAMVLSCGVVLGKKYGALAAGIGSALSDIYLGYASWALPTFIIKALMAFIVGYMFENLTDKKRLITITGVYITLWAGFNFLVRGLISSQNVVKATEALIADEVISTENELLNIASSTQDILILIAILIPITLIIALLIGKFNTKLNLNLHKIATFIVAGSIMVILYYATYGILYGNWIVPVFSIPANMIQYGVGLILALLLLPITTRFKLDLQN